VSEQPNGALSLDDVSRRFAESEQALGAARESLERLASVEESASASAASLQQSSEAVREFAKGASVLIGELEQTQRQTREVLETGARFLDGTELRELREALGNLALNLEERLTQLDQRVGDVQAAEGRASQLEEELDRRTAKLTSRQRKQLGLT
jgi:chromosome segregation ATPase